MKACFKIASRLAFCRIVSEFFQDSVSRIKLSVELASLWEKAGNDRPPKISSIEDFYWTNIEKADQNVKKREHRQAKADIKAMREDRIAA